jgi:hypothetical protein
MKLESSATWVVASSHDENENVVTFGQARRPFPDVRGIHARASTKANNLAPPLSLSLSLQVCNIKLYPICTL